MAKKSVTFEESIQRLDEIVRTLEGGEASLEESIKLFEEGTKLSAKCAELLDAAELKVTQLMKGPDGAPVEQEIPNA
jgi:exodeoxyribonuclease VII small subunit